MQVSSWKHIRDEFLFQDQRPINYQLTWKDFLYIHMGTSHFLHENVQFCFLIINVNLY